MHGHTQAKIVIMEEGNRPYPMCPQCDMFVSRKALKSRQMTTASCQRSAERKRRSLMEEEVRAVAETVFTSDEIPLFQVTSFKYLGQILMEVDNNWPVVVSNLRKARRNWAQLTRVLGREGVDSWTFGQI